MHLVVVVVEGLKINLQEIKFMKSRNDLNVITKNGA